MSRRGGAGGSYTTDIEYVYSSEGRGKKYIKSYSSLYICSRSVDLSNVCVNSYNYINPHQLMWELWKGTSFRILEAFPLQCTL